MVKSIHIRLILKTINFNYYIQNLITHIYLIFIGKKGLIDFLTLIYCLNKLKYIKMCEAQYYISSKEDLN